MSIIPGIDSRAPERTETSSGSSASPSRLPARSSSARSASASSLGEPVGLGAVVAHVLHARLRGDGEAGRHALRAEHARHLRDVRALAAEQLAHVAAALVERHDPSAAWTSRSCGGLLLGECGGRSAYPAERPTATSRSRSRRMRCGATTIATDAVQPPSGPNTGAATQPCASPSSVANRCSRIRPRSARIAASSKISRRSRASARVCSSAVLRAEREHHAARGEQVREVARARRVVAGARGARAPPAASAM